MEYDPELLRLRADNKSLGEELHQCQADKDFVWSLWRKLQVANPDITQAVGVVVQREKEKAELKDRKVLEILQIKDDKIEELHSMLAGKGRELQDLKSKQVDQEKDSVALKNENSALQERLSLMEDQSRSMKTREQNMDGYHRQVITEMQSEKEVLQRQLLQQERKVTGLESDIGQLRTELKHSLSEKHATEVQCKSLQKDITNKVSQFEELLRDLDNAKHMVQKLEAQNRQNLMEIEEKNKELETVRRELSELWTSHHQLNEHATQQADMIRQLQSLQQDTQKMLKNQEDAYSIEATSLQQMYSELTSRYDCSKKAESELRKEMLSLKKRLFERDDTIVQLQHQLDLAQIDNRTKRDQQESFIEAEKETTDLAKQKIENLMTEIHLLKESLHNKDRIIEDMEQNLERTFQFNPDQLKESNHSTPIKKEYRNVAVSPFAQMSRSPSPRSPERSQALANSDTNSDRNGEMLTQAEAKITDMKVLLSLKNEEVKELRIAHDRRLERLKSIQTNYRLVKEQLKTFEDDNGNKKKKKLRRSHPRELQKENSDAVWNELAFFKNEAKTFQTQRLNLQEENDLLHVQTSQDKATIHELKLALEQEKEELQFQLEQRDVERTEKYSSQITSVRTQMEEKDMKLEQCIRELRETTQLRDKFLEERKILRSELTHLTQTGASYRMEIASLKREINRLEKDLERGKMLLRREVASLKIGPSISRTHKKKRSKRTLAQHSRNVSSSTEKSSSTFDDDEWEEVTSDTEETLTESDSLGRAIASTAQSFHATPNSCSNTKASYIPRAKSKAKIRNTQRSALTWRHLGSLTDVKGRTQDHGKVKSSGSKVYRDASTSPVTILSASPTNRSPNLRSPNHRPPSRKGRPTQQRIDSLQQQLLSLRDSRATALKAVSDLKETNLQLQSDLSLANQRLKMSKQNIQKLTADLEKVQHDRSELESKLLGESTLNDSTRHTEQEWKTLENRLKSATTEVTRQAGVIKVLKSENESMSDQVKTLQDRLNHVERDNTQKRSLLEKQKSRLKLAKESVQSEASLISDLEAKIDQLTEANDKLKIQFESSKKRATVLNKERREHEERFIKLSTELEKKSKLLSECQSRKMDLESALTDLESTAQQQLHGLASHSEAAIDVAQQQLSSTHFRLEQFQKFVKALVHEICTRCQQARSLSHHYNQQSSVTSKPPDRSMLKAQSLARDILNISQSDLDDIMSVDLEKDQWETEVEDEKKKDKKWSKKCERLMLTENDFVLPLVDLIMEKMDERQELLTRLKPS